MKEDFFSKFKNYNKELEKILEKKGFSEDVKNLLLSMFYKLNTSYNDYFLVKTKCKTKQKYLNNVLENLKATNSMELVKPNDFKFKELKENGLYEINYKMKRITVIATEMAVLSSLLGLNDFEVHVKEEYNLIKNSMQYLLNSAYDMEKIEVIRDFNSWSWNALVEEMSDVNVNLVYQTLKIALNRNIFDKLEEENIDVIQHIRQILEKQYNQEKVVIFLNLIFKISIMIYIQYDADEKNRLLEAKESLESKLNGIKNTKEYIEQISEQKKILTDKLKEIDLIMNNKDLLLEEYTRRNKQLSEYNKIFNLSHLVEKLQRERTNILNKIDMYNKKSDPAIYLENREKLEKDYEILKDIDFEKNSNMYKYIEQLEELFIKELFIQKIQAVESKNEIIDCMYELRYYNFLPYNNEKKIKDVESLKEYIEHAKEILIRKMYDKKILNNISTNLENDIQIAKNIFNLKIINMESIYVEIKESNENYIISIYDEKETLENEIVINLKFNPKDKIKLNKKIKLFKSER